MTPSNWPGPGPGLGQGLFIIGSDTGVGKTTIAVALARLAIRRGRRPVPYKPVETGCDPTPLDAERLWRAAGCPVPLDEVCPFALPLPAAPSAAAAARGVRIDLDDLDRRARALAPKGDLLIVEGAGGLLVPYNGGQTTADLAQRLALPVVVVGRVALGTVNHVSLTLSELGRRHAPIAGVVLVQTTPDRQPHEASNAPLIRDVTGIAPFGVFPYLPVAEREDPDRLADALVGAVSPTALAQLLGEPLSRSPDLPARSRGPGSSGR
jgi:dethiobiotin synthetase